MKTLHWDMIDPATGRPYTFDNPNLRWGSPSVVLEPGDPGYVPVAPVSEKPKPKKETMKQRYYPPRAAAQVQWLTNFWLKLLVHGPAVDLTPDVINKRVADARWLAYAIGAWIGTIRTFGKSATAALEDVRFGDDSGEPGLPVLTLPALPPSEGTVPAVVPQPPGALNRIFAVVQQIKEATGYTDAIGADLGLIGPEESPPDLTLIQPDLGISISGNKVLIDWGWEGYERFVDQCEIQVDRGAGWTLLTIDTTPGCVDSHPHPATPTKWSYRAIYRVDDEPIGQWSPVRSVLLGQ